VSDWVNRLDLTRLSTPLFGRVSVALVLLMALHLTANMPLERLGQGISVGTVSAAGLLPAWLYGDVRLLALLWVAFVVCGALWMGDWMVPLSSWGATLAFTGYVSVYLQNAPFWDHKCHLLNLVMFVQCAWYHIYAQEIRAARREGRLLTTPLYPQWAYVASVFAICCHYFFAGLSKLIEGGGLRWADGLTFQLWILARGDGDTWLGSMVLAHRSLSQVFQITALGFELLVPLALFWPRFRVAVGLFFIGFHLSSHQIFPDVVFTANLVVVCLFFVMEPALAWWAARQARMETESVVSPEG